MVRPSPASPLTPPPAAGGFRGWRRPWCGHGRVRGGGGRGAAAAGLRAGGLRGRAAAGGRRGGGGRGGRGGPHGAAGGVGGRARGAGGLPAAEGRLGAEPQLLRLEPAHAGRQVSGTPGGGGGGGPAWLAGRGRGAGLAGPGGGGGGPGGRPVGDAGCPGRSGHVGVSRLLLESGAEANAQSRLGASALSVAARGGHLGVAQLLLSWGARVDGGGVGDGPRGEASGAWAPCPLSAAALEGQEAVARLLLEWGAACNGAGRPGGWSPLMLAAAGGRLSLARLLVQAGAEPDQRNALHKTPYDLAADARHHALRDYLAPLTTASPPSGTLSPDPSPSPPPDPPGSSPQPPLLRLRGCHGLCSLPPAPVPQRTPGQEPGRAPAHPGCRAAVGLEGPPPPHSPALPPSPPWARAATRPLPPAIVRDQQAVSSGPCRPCRPLAGARPSSAALPAPQGEGVNCLIAVQVGRLEGWTTHHD